MIVKAELENMGLSYRTVQLGELEVKDQLSSADFQQLKATLLKSGLELLDDKKADLVEKIKNVIIEMVHYLDEPTREKIICVYKPETEA